jgi:hypothetical protein
LDKFADLWVTNLSGGPDAVPGVLLRARAWARASYDDRVLSSGLDRDQ